ncbi:MAG: energy transducer TonB [Flavobacteriia bacterium]|nr:energy transducer TonB [Flavobacteriia bacterium]
MKILLIIFTLSNIYTFSFSQSTNEGTETFIIPESEPKSDSIKSEEIATFVDEQAEYPGGHEAFSLFLSKNINYPKSALNKNIQGKSFIKFVVDKEGQIKNIVVVKGVPDCPECDREAIRILKLMPNWKPAQKDGKIVNSYYVVPINFKLTK